MSQPPDAPPPPPAFPFAPQEALEFMQKMWNPFGMAIPGFPMPGMPGAAPPGAMPFPNPAALYATLDPAEIERKIGELRVVENWLTMTLHLMQMSIKTMELQKASMEALRSAQTPGSAASAKSDSHRKKKS